MQRETIPFAKYLLVDGRKYTVNGVQYTIRAKLREQKYPYYRKYIDLSAEHKDGLDKTWFTDLKVSEGKTVNKLFSKMDKDIQKIQLQEENENK